MISRQGCRPRLLCAPFGCCLIGAILLSLPLRRGFGQGAESMQEDVWAVDTFSVKGERPQRCCG